MSYATLRSCATPDRLNPALDRGAEVDGASPVICSIYTGARCSYWEWLRGVAKRVPRDVVTQRGCEDKAVRCPIRVDMHRYCGVIVRLDKVTVLCLGELSSSHPDSSNDFPDLFDCMDE